MMMMINPVQKNKEDQIMVRIGIDVGGTGVQLGAVDENLNIIARSSIPTRTDIPFGEQVRNMAECVLSLFEEGRSPRLRPEDVVSVGVGIPGIADREGNVIRCTNLGWKDVPFRSEFVKYLDKPVFIDNDANVAALAESVAGAAKGTSSSVTITLGTGIGSGIIINGKIWNGAHGIGSELGHTILALGGRQCSCGNRGCLERYCSATAIIQSARELLPAHPESSLMDACGSDLLKINAKMIIDAAKAGDALGMQLFSDYVSWLGQGIANVVNFLDPEVIILGGGVSKAGAFLLDALREEFPKYVIFNDQPLPSLELAVMGPDAGIVGAAMLS